jgi:hypothetical protein
VNEAERVVRAGAQALRECRAEVERLGRQLRDAQGQAELFRGALDRKDAEVERLRAALESLVRFVEQSDGKAFDYGELQVVHNAHRALAAEEPEEVTLAHPDFTLREILRAWALGDTDKMNVLMMSAFLREFGEAPALAAEEPE